MGRGATALLLAAAAACGDLDLVDDPTLPTADLLILGLQQDGRTVSAQTAFVKSAAETYVRVLHDDPFRTVYVEVRFPQGCLAALGGEPVGPTDSVLVTLEPEPDRYGVTLSPVTVSFAPATPPYATFSFATYGDLSVADGSDRYATRAAYASALALWFEVTPGRWSRVAGSGFTGTDAVAGRLAEPGTYLVAAER